MDESTTRKLAEILSDIDSTNEMDQYMEHPKVVTGFRGFRFLARKLQGVRQRGIRSAIKNQTRKMHTSTLS